MGTPPLISLLDWDDSPDEVAARWPVNQPLLWLHSGRVHRRWARWSIMASPRVVWRFDAISGSRWVGDRVPAKLAAVRFTDDPLHDLDAVLQATAREPLSERNENLPFSGGWIGYCSYDLGRVIEPRAQHAVALRDESDWPLIDLAWCPEALVFDSLSRRWWAIDDRAAGDGRSIVRGLLSDSAVELASHAALPLHEPDFHLGEIAAHLAPSQYERMVSRTIEYIAAGDIFQANIAQRFSAEFAGSTRALAIEAFSSAQPWYGAYLEFAGHSTDSSLRRAILSLSPELFLQLEPRAYGRRIVTRPIKGTLPAWRGADALRDSIKDQAELNMIVDLMRNDLGRVCTYGSVRVPQPRAIETHPTVHHGVAEITGVLRDDVTIGDVLRATFPPGSVTGAPKIRAMQIIDELEAPPQRGPYCGAMGFISDCGSMMLNVAIRTMLLQGRGEGGRCDRVRDAAVSYQAGAGIVADSNPAREQQETLDKAAVLRALAVKAPKVVAAPAGIDR